MNLDIISKQLKENRSAQEDTTHEVKLLSRLISKQILQAKRDRMDALGKGDEVRETAQVIKSQTKGASGDGGKFPPLIGNLLGLLRGLAGPLGLVALAELTDTDAFLRALGIPKLVSGAKKALNGIANIFTAVKNFELPKIALDFDGKKFQLKMPELPKFGFFTSVGEAITEKVKLKLPELPKFSFADITGKIFNAGEPIKLKLPELPRFTIPQPKISIPELKIPTLTINDEAVRIMGKFRDVIGSLSGGPGTGGTGILGFFGRAFSILDPILKPIRAVASTILRPFTQILISVVDFISGFWEGWKKEKDGKLSDRILSGLEEGFLSVIEGITEAFDLLFVTVPAWFLEKFGMQNAAEVLRGFSLTALVRPIWAGIKGIVTFVGDQFMNMKDIVVGSFTIQLTRIINGFKKGFERLSNFIANLGDELYLMIAKNFRFRLPEVAIDLPNWLGGRTTIIPKIDVGVGTAESIAATEEQIDRRNAKSEMKIRALDKEVADMMKAQQDRLAELNNAFQNQVVNAVNNSTNTTNNTQNTVLNAPQMPTTVDQPIAF